MITSGALAPIEVGVTVTAAAPTGQLANSGGALPMGIALAAGLALVAGGVLVGARRRRVS